MPTSSTSTYLQGFLEYCAAKFPPLFPEIEMSYKHKFENKDY